MASLVLFEKPGKSVPQLSLMKYRPSWLISELGKMFERIIKYKMEAYMSNSGKQLSNKQYGFVKGRSTVNAIEDVKYIVEINQELGLRTLAVSIYIANAFNTLEWVGSLGLCA